ncbi:MAG: dTMP kinase [Candidatus Woesearchaeota archaeon]
MLKKRKGRLIVIEGIDGSGKATQTRILLNHLKKNKIKCSSFSFPNYSTKYGRLIRKCLSGELGSIDEVDPYYFASLYSEDRKLASESIRKDLENGKIIVIDRYVYSNFHQMSKLPEKDQPAFLKWMIKNEFKNNKLPKEDLLLYLYIPVKNVLRLIKKRNINKKVDIHEENEKHLKDTQNIFLDQANKNKSWHKIDCIKNNKFLSKKEISRKIKKIVEKII